MIGIETLFIDGNRPVTRTMRVARALLVFAACAGLVIAGVVVTRNAVDAQHWTTTPCSIVWSGVDSVENGSARDHPYHPRITFTYIVDGETHAAHLSDQNDYGTDNAAEAYAQVRKFPIGLQTICYVNPHDPSKAILIRDEPQKAELFLVAAVLVMLAALWFYCIPQLRKCFASIGYPLQGRRQQQSYSKNRVAITAAVFLMVSFGALTVAWYVLPLIHNMKAHTWPAVPCEIVETNVQSQRISGEIHLTVYRTDILYRYRVGNETYHSNQFSLTEGSSVSHDSRERFVKQYATGQTTTCYVNPANANDAVLSRRVSPTIVFGIWPLALTFLGGTILVATGNQTQVNTFFSKSKWTLVVICAAAMALVIWAIFAPP